MARGLLLNLIILSTFVVAATLYAFEPETYYRAAQEDHFLEWVTFWSFLLAAVLFVRNAVDDRRRRGGAPWFAAGLAVFCFVVALEEISWGQRLLGFRPPDYFLEHNYQQELNLHNVADSQVRALLLQFILLGYGVTLSGISLLAPARRWFERLRIVPPPPVLMPGFAVIAALYAAYPTEYTGEWAECAMSLAFLLTASLTGIPEGRSLAARSSLGAVAAALLGAGATVLVFDITTAPDAERREAARRELRALARDFESPKLHTRCGIHKRLYTFAREYGQPHLLQGEFAALAIADSIQARAGYLLDPWNSPYWVRHKCEDGESVAFVYSFGPNRQRDSSEWELRGDDIGEYFSKRR